MGPRGDTRANVMRWMMAGDGRWKTGDERREERHMAEQAVGEEDPCTATQRTADRQTRRKRCDRQCEARGCELGVIQENVRVEYVLWLS